MRAHWKGMFIFGEDGFATADATYYESEERRRLSPDPAVHIVSSQADATSPIL
ncbi:MAG: hypothetical protein O7C01_00580 [Actinobacteria bacterium]|nr:hypothetical protein [Actinomycetota bacterium]